MAAQVSSESLPISGMKHLCPQYAHHTRREPFFSEYLVSVVFESIGTDCTLQNKLNETICRVLVNTFENLLVVTAVFQRPVVDCFFQIGFVNMEFEEVHNSDASYLELLS